MVTILFWFIIFYLSFKFVFGFVVPLITTTRQVRTHMKDMQQNVRDYKETNGQTTANHQSPPGYQTKVSKEDYLDFEEIK